MLLTIYGSNGIIKAEISPSGSSTQTKEIQGDNVLSLSFKHYQHIDLDVNDYIDFEGERYWLTEQYKPKQLSTIEWDYNVKFYGIESLIKRFLVLMTADGADEPMFTLTATPREHVAMIVRCINDGMGHITDWKVGRVDGADKIVIDYHGTYCDEGLKQVAEKVGAEWWIEGTTVNVCKCEQGEEITLGYNSGLTSIDRGTADNVKFYTRLFPVGSSRNIDRSFYGSTRLHLPGGDKYVEVNTDKYGIIDHYEEEAFADIYPRRIGVVSSVRSEEKRGEDGNMFTIYYFTDNSLTFDPNDYEIPGLVKRVSFQEGSELAGLGDEEDGTYFFECNFNSRTREFEIITIWPFDDDTQLPGNGLIPAPGNRYILWNIRMPDEYYGMAEEELASAVQQYNQEHCIDVSVYRCPTDHVWIENHEAELYIGRKVNLESAEFFPVTGHRSSRITKITRKVTLPSQMDLEISDALSKGTLSKMSSDIQDAKNYAKTMCEASGVPDIIRSWDNTPATDTNLYSARRSMLEFLSKKRRDRAKEPIIFEKGIEIGDYSQGETGGLIDRDANAEFLSLVIREMLHSPRFVQGFTGEGWRLWLEDGLSHLELDRLTVRQIMTVFELVINKIRAVGGQMVVSAANGKIKEIDDLGDQYKIAFEDDNYFAAHDLIRCQVFTGSDIRGYWVEVASIDGNAIVIDKSEFDEWDTEPRTGDECVLMGNTENPMRQNLISISAAEDGQPRFDVLDRVSSKSFDGCLRARFGALDGISDDWFPLDKQPTGYGIYSDNAYLRGTFLLVTGEDILTKFEIVEGKIESSVEGLRQDFATDKGFLSNPTFGDGMSAWDTLNEAVFFLVGNKWIWANGNVLSRKGDCASVVKDNGRTVVRIRNKYISQANANLRSIPTFDTNGDNQKMALPVYLTFFYRCAKPGTLKVEFENVDKSGFENFNSFSVEEHLETTDGYKQYTCNGLWNGTGDFKLSFTGEIYLYMLILTTDRVESLTYKYRTLFEQSDRLVKFSAQALDADGNILESSNILTTSKYNALISSRFNEDGTLKNCAGLVTTAMANNLFVFDADGNIVSMIEQTASTIKIKAEHIALEGIVTVNNGFKINSNGTMEANGATIRGTIYATAGNIGGFTLERQNLIWAIEERYADMLIRRSSIMLGNNYREYNIATNSWIYHSYALLDIRQFGYNESGMTCLYVSTKATPTMPDSLSIWAAYLEGSVYVSDNLYANKVCAVTFRAHTSNVPVDGSFSGWDGISFDYNDYDLDKVRFQVRGGIIVGVRHE